MKHTPGPWETCADGYIRQIDRGIAERRLWVATAVDIPHSEGGEAATTANMRLIAQAPAMLEALRKWYEWLCTGEAQASAYHRENYKAVTAILQEIDGEEN